MTAAFLYLCQVIVISGMLYGYYHFFLRNKKFHGYNRFYLLASAILSCIIPFLNIPVYFESRTAAGSSLLHTLTVIKPGSFEEKINTLAAAGKSGIHFTWTGMAWFFYSALLVLLGMRFLLSIIKIFRLKKLFPVDKIDSIHFINTTEPSTPFSFFRNLFWNDKIALDSADGQQIFRHECFHIKQKHSLDIIFTEILSIAFWMNPFFYWMKKELKTIHEFLADRFAANTDEEWNYAELLLMQVLGSPNQRLTNHFFHNQIKRRIAMITNSPKTSYQYARKLLVLPVAILITALFAFTYKTKQTYTPVSTPFEKTITVIIDAGHGESAPGATAADGTKESDITLQLAKRVKELNVNERIHIVLTRNSKEIVDLKKRTEIANAQNPDLFISLHAGAADGTTDAGASGFEVYISKNNAAYYAENKILGAILLNYFANIYKTTNRIQQHFANIWVLDNSNCPSALVECGYMTNKKDLAFIKNPANQIKIAEGILKSIEQYSLQKDMPDFEDRKKQVSDSTKPVVKISKTTGGAITGTVNGIDVKALYLDKKSGSAGFLLENNSLVVIPKEEVEALQQTYLELWTEFANSIEQKTVVQDKPNAATKTGNNIVFTKAENEPMFPGGEHAWLTYLQRNLNANTPVDNNAPEGAYTVWVEFLVASDGTVSNVKALTTAGYGMEQEAVKIFKYGPKWVPALQNGKKVSAYKKQPVTFVVKNESITG